MKRQEIDAIQIDAAAAAREGIRPGWYWRWSDSEIAAADPDSPHGPFRSNDEMLADITREALEFKRWNDRRKRELATQNN
jgi:hypothetical protein